MSHYMQETWKSRIEHLISERGTNRNAVSTAIGRNRTYIRDVLDRGTVPSIDSAIAIAQSLGVTVGYLVGETTDKNGLGLDYLANLIEDTEARERAINEVRGYLKGVARDSLQKADARLDENIAAVAEATKSK